MAANPNYLGTIDNGNVIAQLPSSYHKMGNWVSIAADTGSGGRAVFTYPATNPGGVTSGMMVEGMARANGFGWGTGIAKSGKMIDTIVQATVPNPAKTGTAGITYTTMETRTQVSVPAAIPDNTAFQMTQIK